MSEHLDWVGDGDPNGSSVPRARTDDLTMTLVGADLVIFDAARFHYHTLNPTAAAVWRLCDGRRTVAEISAAALPPLPAETVALAVAELGEAGLLASPAEGWDARVARRRVLKLAAAGLLGGALVPAVASITAPHPAAAQSTGDLCNNNVQCNSNCCGFGGVCKVPGSTPVTGPCVRNCECVSNICILNTCRPRP